MCDGEGRILYSNPATKDLLGNMAISRLTPQWQQVVDWLETRTGVFQFVVEVDSATRIPVEAAAARLESEGVTTFVLFLTDQREHRKTRQELGAARDRLKLLADQLVHSQEAERTHIAREIHDGLLQYIVGAGMYLDKVRSGGELSLLDTAALRLESASLEGRRLIGELRPPSLDDFGLAETIEEMLKSAAKEARFTPRLSFDLKESELPDALKVNLLRLVQEAITNVVRHSGAKKAEVSLWRDPESLRVRVWDDGKGFDPDSVRGVGLSSMEERAHLFGGSCWIESVPGSTSVEASLPWSCLKSKLSEEDRRPEEILPSFFSRLRRQVETQLQDPANSAYDAPMTLAEEELKALAHELQVYQIELEMQNEELRRGQLALEHERDRYRVLFEHAPVGYLVLTPELAVRQANLASCELLDLEREALMGKTLESLICLRSRDQLQQLCRLGSGQKELWIRRHRAKTPVPVRLQLRELWQGEDSAKLVVLCRLDGNPAPSLSGHSEQDFRGIFGHE